MNIQDIVGRTIAEVNEDPREVSCLDEIGVVFTDGSRIIIRASDGGIPGRMGDATIDVMDWEGE